MHQDSIKLWFRDILNWLDMIKSVISTPCIRGKEIRYFYHEAGNIASDISCLIKYDDAQIANCKEEIQCIDTNTRPSAVILEAGDLSPVMFITSRITARLLRKEPETDGDMSDISPQNSAGQDIRRKWI